MSEQYLTIEHLTTKELARIFSKIKIDPLTQCWQWTAYIDKHNGYGRFTYRLKPIAIHRLLYAWLVGPVPKRTHSRTLQIDHLCRNRSCCNPAHCELVTPKENILRGTSPQAANATKTHCPQGHEYTQENTYRHGNAQGRQCKACLLAKHRAAYAKRKQDPEYMAQKRANAMDYYFKYAADPEWRARRAKYESERNKKKTH